MSARRPKMKVRVARRRPMMVRYCQCQPYDALIGVGKALRNQYEAAKEQRPRA